MAFSCSHYFKSHPEEPAAAGDEGSRSAAILLKSLELFNDKATLRDSSLPLRMTRMRESLINVQIDRHVFARIERAQPLGIALCPLCLGKDLVIHVGKQSVELILAGVV